MALTLGEKIKEDDSIPILITTYIETHSYIKGCHAYKNLWKPVSILLINFQLGIYHCEKNGKFANFL